MRTGAARSNSTAVDSNLTPTFMGTIIIGIIATLLLIYLFATMIYPEKF